jgi:hypothetical protein
VGHRAPVLDVRVTPPAAIPPKLRSALGMLPCGGDGESGLVLPVRDLRATAAARAALATLVLPACGVSDEHVRQFLPKEGGELAGGPRVPGWTLSGGGDAFSSEHSLGVVSEDDRPWGAVGVGHSGAAALCRAIAEPLGPASRELRTVLRAVLQAGGTHATPQQVMSAVSAAAVRSSLHAMRQWPVASDEDDLLVIASPAAESGSAFEPFDVAQTTVGPANWSCASLGLESSAPL